MFVDGGEGVWIRDGDVHLRVERAKLELRPAKGRCGNHRAVVDCRTLVPCRRGTVLVLIDLQWNPAELVADEPCRHLYRVGCAEIERHVPTELRVRCLR